MKRGLIFWDRAAWPEEEFRLKIERVRIAMRREGLDVLLVYGDACQSGDLSYLTHFIPYADTGLFVLPAHGRPRLFTTHALRNMAWFRTITWVEDIVCTNHIGDECAMYLGGLGISGPRIGTVPARAFPHAVVSAVLARTGAVLSDFTAAYEELRAVKSDYELASVRKAGTIAVAVLQGLSGCWRPGITGFDIAAEAEREARSLGSEDLFCFIQADNDSELTLPAAGRILRRASVEIAIEYNGYWAKLGRTMILEGPVDISSSLDRFGDAYRAGLEAWQGNRHLPSFFENVRARWGAPVAFQTDFGLEPYWGMNPLRDKSGDGILKDQGVLYLQATAILKGWGRFLRTDTFAFKDGKPELITGLHRSEGRRE